MDVAWLIVMLYVGLGWITGWGEVKYPNASNSLRNVPDVLASTLSADTHAKRVFAILKEMR